MMYTVNRTPTTEMEVTSIRLERDLKNHLKGLAGDQGYQALIRDVLWNYVQQKTGQFRPSIRPNQIRASVGAIAQQEETCALTGKIIHPQESMLLGWTYTGEMVPLSEGSLAA